MNRKHELSHEEEEAFTAENAEHAENTRIKGRQ